MSVAGPSHERSASLRARLTAPRVQARTFAPRRFQQGPFDVRWVPFASMGTDSSWRALTQRAIEPNVFLEPAFALAAAEHFGRSDLGALTVHAGPRLVGLLPGRVEGLAAGRLVPAFVAWTHPFAPLSTPLLDRDMAVDTMAAMLDTMPQLPGAPKVALFPLLPDTSVAAQAIELHVRARALAAVRMDAHARAALVPDRDEALGMVSSTRRKELSRQRRRLMEEGVLGHDTAVQVGAVRSAIADFMEVEARGWKGRAGGAALRSPAAAAFMTEAVTSLAADRKVRIDRLTLDGAPIAATITLFSGAYAWFWKIAYDERYARFSPGVQLALDLTGALEADKSLSLVDSCAVAGHPMIDHLWSGRLAVADWLVPLGGPVWLAAASASERARRTAVVPLKAFRQRLRR